MLCSANINGNLYVFKENAGVFLQTGQLFIPLASTERSVTTISAKYSPIKIKAITDN